MVHEYEHHRKIYKIGSSYAINLPKHWVEANNLHNIRTARVKYNSVLTIYPPEELVEALELEIIPEQTEDDKIRLIFQQGIRKLFFKPYKKEKLLSAANDISKKLISQGYIFKEDEFAKDLQNALNNIVSAPIAPILK